MRPGRAMGMHTQAAVDKIVSLTARIASLSVGLSAVGEGFVKLQGFTVCKNSAGVCWTSGRWRRSGNRPSQRLRASDARCSARKRRVPNRGFGQVSPQVGIPLGRPWKMLRKSAGGPAVGIPALAQRGPHPAASVRRMTPHAVEQDEVPHAASDSLGIFASGFSTVGSGGTAPG